MFVRLFMFPTTVRSLIIHYISFIHRRIVICRSATLAEECQIPCALFMRVVSRICHIVTKDESKNIAVIYIFYFRNSTHTILFLSRVLGFFIIS